MDQADAQFHFVLNQSTNNIPALLGTMSFGENFLSSCRRDQFKIIIAFVFQ